MSTKQPSRRRFIKKGAALAGLAAAPAALAVAPRSASGQARVATVPDMNTMEYVLYGQRSRFVNTERVLEDAHHHEVHRPRPDPYRPSAGTPLRDQVGIITPSSLHFATQHHYGIPDINPSEHQLTIHGMVDRPMVFTMDALKRFPAASGIHFLECLGNRPRPTDKTVNDSHGRAACSEWTGVPLSLLLKEAGIKNGAGWIVAEGSDAGQHTKSVPMAKVMDDVLVAYGQNGEPVRPDQGFPMRLLVPGFEGIYNVKWLKTIKVVDQPYITFQEKSRYLGPDRRSRHFINELGPKSVITYPSGEDRLLDPGNYTITGLAWSGGGAVRRVEVSVDGGRSWTDAELRGPALKRAFTRFDLVWRWTGEEAVIQSRCTDELDQVQPSAAEFARFWKQDTVAEIFQGMGSRFGHVNIIQPWKVAANGTVHNALDT